MLAATLFVFLAAPLDHSGFDGLLRAHVTEAGRVDYDAFARSGEFRRYLEARGPRRWCRR
ncbi:MAG TPA: hypothetical protein VE359_12000 [Vicinamibacteria bacterium]|nr:hypothetical protein [Vicinamibacteria bacterium]